MALSPPILEHHGLALDPAKILEPATKSRYLWAVGRRAARAEKADSRDCSGLGIGDSREHEDEEDREPEPPHR
jgi:hypothetical protein